MSLRRFKDNHSAAREYQEYFQKSEGAFVVTVAEIFIHHHSAELGSFISRPQSCSPASKATRKRSSETLSRKPKNIPQNSPKLPSSSLSMKSYFLALLPKELFFVPMKLALISSVVDCVVHSMNRTQYARQGRSPRKRREWWHSC